MSASPKQIFITVIAKEPPGGRCSLYSRYAEVLRISLGAQISTIVASEAPALTVNGQTIAPSDGVILSSNEVHDGLVRAGLDLPRELSEILVAVETRFMEELEQ